MENIKKVKEYDVRIIASIMENAFLCNSESEIFNCAEDIINEEVDILNYREKSTKVIEEIKRQCPYIKRITPYPMDNLDSDLINEVCDFYIKSYGETIFLKVYPIKRKKLTPFHFKY